MLNSWAPGSSVHVALCDGVSLNLLEQAIARYRGSYPGQGLFSCRLTPLPMWLMLLLLLASSCFQLSGLSWKETKAARDTSLKSHVAISWQVAQGSVSQSSPSELSSLLIQTRQERLDQSQPCHKNYSLSTRRCTSTLTKVEMTHPDCD